MAAPSFEKARKGYANLWRSMALQPGRAVEATQMAKHIIAGKARYQAVEKITGVPWYFIGLLYSREDASLSFNTYLGNGQSLHQVTTLVPRGRGPFKTFEAGAVDALAQMGYDTIKDWSVEHILYLCEKFNGFGYYGRINSPYVWAATNHQQRGKFKELPNKKSWFDPNEWDTQLGCAAVLYALCQQDAVVNQRINPPSQGGPNMSTTTPTTTTVDVSPWYASKTIWTNIIGALATLATIASKGHINVDPATQDAAAGIIVTIWGVVSSIFRANSTSVTPTAAKAR